MGKPTFAQRAERSGFGRSEPRAALIFFGKIAITGAVCSLGFLGCSDDSTPFANPGSGGSAASGGQAGSAGGRAGSAGSGAGTGPRGGSAGSTTGAGASAGSSTGVAGNAAGSGSGAVSGSSGLGGSGATSGQGGSSGTTDPGAGGASDAGEGGTSASGGSSGSAGTNGTSGSAGTTGTAGSNGGSVDAFGIRQIYPTAPNSTEWTSEHWDGDAYDLSSRTDSHDPLGISGMRGEGELEVTGDGELVMSGSQPRIYIYESDSGPWQNLEITVYYMRVEDEATAYAGLVIGARSGPEGHTDSTACDAHTYYARIRNDGAFDFEKELEHPASSTQARVQPATAWPPDGDVPFDTWIGFKFVIYNLDAPDSVKLEAYRDLSNGVDGGTWTKVNETIDDGGWSVETTCEEHSPNGGESDLVVTDGGTTFIRNTDVTEARYRWVTVREITPP